MNRTQGNRTGTRTSYSTKRKKPRSIARIIKRLLIVFIFLSAGGLLGLASVFYYYSLSLPSIGPLLEGYEPLQITRILSADRQVIGEIFEERRTVVPIKDIPKHMIDAVIAAEDSDFRKHQGLDYLGIARAAWKNLRRGRLSQGASTITQQVARTFFLTRERSFSRKIREALLTKKIEELLTKDEILFLYLNQINFGHARYGVYEAARFYFGKNIKDISLSQAAVLAAIPKGPSIYSPFINPEAAINRRGYVLKEMKKNKLITDAEFDAANADGLTLVSEPLIDNSLAPEAAALAVDALKEHIDIKELKRGGYTIITTVDSKLQKEARQALKKGLVEIDTRNTRIAPFKAAKIAVDKLEGELSWGRIYVGEVVSSDNEHNRLLVRVGNAQGFINLASAERYNPKKLSAEDFAKPGVKLRVSLFMRSEENKPAIFKLEAGPQGALAAVRPSTGEIVALVGGDDVIQGGFDRASRAKRQAGSAFKPFVYLAALITGKYTTATLLDDAPEVQGEWQPQNAHQQAFVGAVRAREALAKSLNLPAVKLISEIGPDAVVTTAKRLGISSVLDAVPSLALGSSVVTPLEMASAYATLANRGIRQSSNIIKKVIGHDGREIPLNLSSSEPVVSEQEAYIITSMMKSVIDEGTGAKAKEIGRPAAGKTGTSNDQKDAWFIGYTPDLACAVWIGFDDLKSLGKKEYGGRAALPVWTDFMKTAHLNIPKRDFEMPPGISVVAIDPKTGLRAYEGMKGAINEVFIEGSEPTETAVPPELLSPDDFLMGVETAETGVSLDF